MKYQDEVEGNITFHDWQAKRDVVVDTAAPISKEQCTEYHDNNTSKYLGYREEYNSPDNPPGCFEQESGTSGQYTFTLTTIKTRRLLAVTMGPNAYTQYSAIDVQCWAARTIGNG